MDKYIEAEVFESWYEDDYNEGEVDGTHHSELVETKKFKTVDEAVGWFKKEYSCPTGGDVFEVLSNNDCVDMIIGWPMMKSTFYGAEVADEKDLERWKAGKINLYDYEYQLLLHEVTESRIADEILEKYNPYKQKEDKNAKTAVSAD